MKPGEFYRVPKQIANGYPVVEGTRCVSVRIPDDDSFLAVLAGMVAELGNTWSSVGTVEERRAYALMWQVAYSETDWEGCMSCEDVADCIENDTDVQDAINNVYNQYGTGVPMPTSTRNTNIGGTIIDCNPDELWGAVNELIDSMNQNNIDAQEALEVVSNIAERIALVYSGIPLAETLPIDEAIDYVQNVWTDTLFEVYEGNDTEGYRDELKCDLFCLSRDNACLLTIDMLYDYFAERVGYVGLDDFAALVAFLTGGVWAGTLVNDIFYLTQCAVLRYGNQFFTITGLRPMEMYMALGANNPDPDWEILCTECNNLCRLEYQFDNDPDGFNIVVGTDEPDFWIESATFSGAEYVVYECDQDVPGAMVRARLYFNDNLYKSCQVFTTTGLYVVNGIPQHAGGGVYVLTADLMGDTGNFTGVLARTEIGEFVQFYLMATTIVYEC